MGNRLSKIVTRTGDDGSTGLADGSRVPKESARIEACGTVDELNSSIGVLLAQSGLPEAMSPQLLDEQIRATLTQRSSQVRVVERMGLSLSDGLTNVILTVPRLLVHIVRELNPLERIACVGWIWSIWFFYHGRRRRPIARSRRLA